MFSKSFFKKALSILTASALCLSTAALPLSYENADADEKAATGSLADRVTGTWSYWDGTQDVVQTNEMLLEKLPSKENQGKTRFTTEDYDASTGAIDIGDWGTSLMWSYTADEWGNSTYAFPLSYKATPQGFYVTKPSTVRVETAFLMEQPEDGSLTDFIVGPDFTAADKRVDKVTDWTYDVVMRDASNPSVSVKVTLTQGSPFSFYQAYGANSLKITRKRPLPSSVIAYDGDDIEHSTMLVFRVFDNQDDSLGYSNHDYYAAYVPEGTVWVKSAGTGYADDGIGTLTARFSSPDKAYMSFAWLCESSGPDDNAAEKIANDYKKYAYNFITDTKAAYDYDKTTSTLTTTYSYTLDRKPESTADGTVMGILPHQYKNMSGYTYLENTARTLRGTMKFIAGTSYDTVLRYTGILPYMMPVSEADAPVIQGYVDDFMAEYGPSDNAVTKEEYSVNTYDTGKKLNRAVQVMAAAEACGDTDSARKLLAGIEAELSDWFTWTGDDDEKYFYYDGETGSLFGFPQAYYTVDGMTDHHFHYGYFINAAAQVALRDPSFADRYGAIVDELIGDIAETKENRPGSRYPRMRYFSQYEGHSWASGHANFGDGNNQESSSEAINAWAGLILYGQATHNEELTELGIYLYTTEISSVKQYWFDTDEDILDPAFRQNGHPMTSMVWGGKYGYETWWTAEPLQIQAINLLPMTPSSFYLAMDPDYILKSFEAAQSNEAAYSGEDKDVNRWNEIWSVYLAFADVSRGMEYFNPDCAPEAGDSKAHALHTLLALEQAGRPDLTISCDQPLAAAFVNDAGEKTYAVYNSDVEPVTAVFSDGTGVESQPGRLTVASDAESAGKSRYTVEHYLPAGDGYVLNEREIKSGETGSVAKAEAKDYSGYAPDESAEGFKAEGQITEDGLLVLKIYYRETEIHSPLPGEDDSLYQKLGACDGLDISYWLIRDDFGVAVKLLDAGRTFYVEYNGGKYTADNTKGYLNRVETPQNVLNGVYKFDTGTLVPDSYTALKIKSADQLVTIIIKYGNPEGAPAPDDPEIELPVPPENQPTDVVSLILGNAVDNTVRVTFRETDAQHEKGQTYHIYVNGVSRLDGVSAGSYEIDGVSAGLCTVMVASKLDGDESDGVTKTIKISGERYAEEATSNAPDPQETATDPESGTPDPHETATDSETGAPDPQESVTDSESSPPETTSPYCVTERETDEAGNDANNYTTATERENSPGKSPGQAGTSVETGHRAGSVSAAKASRAKVKKAVRKKAHGKVKITLKKLAGIHRYQIQISKSKKFCKKDLLLKKTVRKVKFTLRGGKFKNRKKLYVRARAVAVSGGKKYYGKWSRKKRVRARRRS